MFEHKVIIGTMTVLVLLCSGACFFVSSGASTSLCLDVKFECLKSCSKFTAQVCVNGLHVHSCTHTHFQMCRCEYLNKFEGFRFELTTYKPDAGSFWLTVSLAG